MAVTTVRNPVIIPLVQTDQRLPIGQWTASISSTGDATGGDNEADIQWSRAAPESLLSVEEINVAVTAAGAGRNIRVAIAVREPSGEAASPTWRWSSIGTLISGSSVDDYDAAIRLAYIFNPSSAAFLIEVITPNVNLEVLQVNAWGYIWGIRARNLEGGPVRPSKR